MPTTWTYQQPRHTDRAMPTTKPTRREPTDDELAAPLNGEWRYPAEWMADPDFRRWVWHQEND